MCSLTQLLIYLVAFLCITVKCDGAGNTGCMERERQALLKFKQDLKDPAHRLSSWTGEDCCRWRGVRCNNRTGVVIQLDLRNPYRPEKLSSFAFYRELALFGEINPSLSALKHLNYLDLSMNQFGQKQIPNFIGSFKKLKYLNLSNGGFVGAVPHQLGNLSSLSYLDLSSDISNYLNVDNIEWLSHLSSLRHLDMSGVNFTEVGGNWAQVINMLPSLFELRLSRCRFTTFPLSILHVNFTSLAIIDLSSNDFNVTLSRFNWLANLTSLVSLDLSSNRFQGLVLDSLRSMGNFCNLQSLILSQNNLYGDIIGFVNSFSRCTRNNLEMLDFSRNKLTGNLPDGLGDFKNLKSLRLNNNAFSGQIPASLGNLSFLQKLFLQSNDLNGTIPQSLGQLGMLVYLDFSYNSLTGILSEVHFAKLVNLEVLDLSFNSLQFDVGSSWVPPFQLKDIGLANSQLGIRFPFWLKTQRKFEYLDLGNASISDKIPDWFWNFSSQIYSLDLSHNQISGKVPDLLKYEALNVVDLSSNFFEGPLAHFPSQVTIINLSNNSFSGPILPIIQVSMPFLVQLSLSGNRLNGSIPKSISKMNSLVQFDLSTNYFSGRIPLRWENFSTIQVLDLSNNNLSGAIPSSMGFLHQLRSLHLNNNSLLGELPLSLKNCTGVVMLDLGNNAFFGKIPSWIGENLLSLRILRLRSNMFYGFIPPQLSFLTNLQVLDLAVNNLSGKIPNSLGHLNSMIEEPTFTFLPPIVGPYVQPDIYQENIDLVMKGRELEYTKILHLVVSIDLSSNSLSGEIPEELTKLRRLVSLNLSGNHLTGKIPEEISDLQLLQSLDMSRNQLSGSIPSSMSALTFLSHLNFSNNNLSGRIPSGSQLQTLTDPSIYAGNNELCGFPLAECDKDVAPLDPVLDDDDGEDLEMVWFYISMGPGFVVGFWGFCGVLIFNKMWRIAYFRFFDDMKDKLFVALILNLAKLQKKLCG